MPTLEPSTIRAAVERLVQRPTSANGHQTSALLPSSGGRYTERLNLEVVRLAGLEPATLGLEVRRSIQLSYRRAL